MFDKKVETNPQTKLNKGRIENQKQTHLNLQRHILYPIVFVLFCFVSPNYIKYLISFPPFSFFENFSLISFLILNNFIKFFFVLFYLVCTNISSRNATLSFTLKIQ